MKVDFINSSYRRYYAAHKDQILKALDKCFSKGDFVLREDVDKFEKNLADFCGAKYAVGVNSGTDALKISYKALGIKPGDEVIVPSHTFLAPIEEIVHLGAKPILIDVGEDALMNVDLLEGLITEKTVGIVPVHLSGKVCDMPRIMAIAKKHNLWVVEDACQALGAYLGKKQAGTFAATGCFSFISPKTLGGAGDAGGIITNDRKVYEKLLLLRNHWNITQNALLGHQPKAPKIMDWGYNSRLDNIQAAILNIKIKYYPAMLRRRRAIGMKYEKGLKDLPIELPTQQPQQIFQEYIIKVPDIWKFKKFMQSKNVELLIRDTTPNHKLPGLGLEQFDLPVTERIAKELVRLPIYPELTDAEVDYVIACVREFFAPAKKAKK
ncbi:MAG: DegT/DnrJ/EryC1/StrS family aminotransferase [Candidatus Pacebacteria bacterium]|jgi:dTDP-4-amino-4,6-dideoxygalactose transaminase|nr:DegT/DnrJ/EryC1/StrS family aminotransferase [Candidatus Paceibacterota bacterium]